MGDFRGIDGDWPKPESETATAPTGMSEDLDLPSDPHTVLEIIRETDRTIERLQRERQKMHDRYHELIKGIEEHYYAVMNPPEKEQIMESDHGRYVR